MVDSFGSTLRALRDQHGWTLAALAARTGYSRSYLSNLESGARTATAEAAQACDTALNCSPLLATVLGIERGDVMLRRALLGGTLGSAATVLLASSDGTAALAAVLDGGLRAAVARPTDWDDLADSFARRYVLAPTGRFAAELAAQISVAQTRIAAGDEGAARGAARLCMTYGLWIGDTGRIPTAHSLYATAAALADHAGDAATRAVVRARAANRGIYEGWTVARTVSTAQEALALYPRGQAALEAHAAMVHLHGLTGNLSAGRAAVEAMQAAADGLPESDGPSARQRVASFRNYLECRAGRLEDALRAFAVAERDLAGVPVWLADATVYLGRAMVAAGDVAGGVAVTVGAMRQMPPYSQRILGIGVRDVIDAAPAGVDPDMLAPLEAYAAAGPVPWETIR